jgi:predicted membrane protein
MFCYGLTTAVICIIFKIFNYTSVIKNERRRKRKKQKTEKKPKKKEKKKKKNKTM